MYKSILSVMALSLVLLVGCSNSRTGPKSEWQTKTQQSQLTTFLYEQPQHDLSSPIVVFVHGDGAADAESFGYFTPIIAQLNKAGMSAVSWHKPGVEGTSGNWLKQSMANRAHEVEEVVADLRRQGYHGKIGVLGFSQAGWVAAHFTSKEIDFVALVSPAINWQQQSVYQMTQRLIREDLVQAGDKAAVAEIQALVTKEHQLIERGYSEYLNSDIHQHPYMSAPITDEDRFYFVKRNMNEDATQGLAKLKVPLLVMTGERDKLVDAAHTNTVVHGLPNRDLTIKHFAGANHQLLNAQEFDGKTGMSWYLTYQQMGAGAFAPGVLPELITWLKAVTR